MATTTNYSWTTPDNTAYVKDGASAIRTLGSSVDTTLFTALGGAYPGLRLVKKQTIGTAVSSVNVTGAFSATYENYQIVVSGGVAAGSAALSLKLGAAATGYYGGLGYVTYSTGAITGAADNNASVFTYAGNCNTTNIQMNVFLNSPFLTKNTMLQTSWVGTTTGASAGNYSGWLNNTTSFTDFTITSASALTGGTIYVYGYGAS